VLVAAPLGIARECLSDRSDCFDLVLRLRGGATVDDVMKDVLPHRQPTQQVVGLSGSCPTSLDFGVQIAQEFSAFLESRL
jgi:hypothetical protein